MNVSYETRRFRLGHVLGVFLGYGIRCGSETFPLGDIVPFMCGIRVSREDFPSAVAACRSDLLRQFPRFATADFVREMARLSVALGYLSDADDPMPTISAWCGEQVSRYGDAFVVRPIRSVFLFLDERERSELAGRTEGQKDFLN